MGNKWQSNFDLYLEYMNYYNQLKSEEVTCWSSETTDSSLISNIDCKMNIKWSALI